MYDIFAEQYDEQDDNQFSHLKPEKTPQYIVDSGLKIVPFQTSKDAVKNKQRASMKNGVIPSHPFRIIINGASGSGKSNLMINLLVNPSLYGGRTKRGNYFDEIYLFSPTAGKLDDLVENLVKHTPFKKLYNEFDQDTLSSILTRAKNDIEQAGVEKSKKRLIILDDIQADQKFLRSKSILETFIQSRHYNISVMLCSQSYTKTPRACRINCSNLMLFPMTGSEADILTKEYCPYGITKKEFQSIIIYCTRERYSFLHIANAQPIKTRFRHNLDVILEIKKDI